MGGSCCAGTQDDPKYMMGKNEGSLTASKKRKQTLQIQGMDF